MSSRSVRCALSVACLALLAAACQRTPSPEAAPPPASEDRAVVDQPEADIPPATVADLAAAEADRAPADAAGAMPAPGTISFAGFGPAPFGANEEQVRIAWGADLGEARPSEPGGCYVLYPQPKPEARYRLGFMFEGDRFVRMDVDTADIAAPGGGRVGMSADDIAGRYGERIERQPHKYVRGGQYLRIRDADGGPGALLFETDAAGTVTEWRIGVPPQVDYVEGCG